MDTEFVVPEPLFWHRIARPLRGFPNVSKPSAPLGGFIYLLQNAQKDAPRPERCILAPTTVLQESPAGTSLLEESCAPGGRVCYDGCAARHSHARRKHIAR